MGQIILMGKTNKKRVPEKGTPKINKQLENRQDRRKANAVIRKAINK